MSNNTCNSSGNNSGGSARRLSTPRRLRLARWAVRSRRARDEAGSMTIELVLLAPVLITVFLLIVGLARMAEARQQVEAAAAAAARASTLERASGSSHSAARAAATQSLNDAGISCTAMDIAIDTSEFTPGGEVEVDVSCTAQLRDVAMSGLPGTQTFSASAVSPIENWRAQ